MKSKKQNLSQKKVNIITMFLKTVVDVKPLYRIKLEKKDLQSVNASSDLSDVMRPDEVGR